MRINGRRLELLVTRAAADTGVPAELLYAMVEAASGGEAERVGPHGELGLLQLAPRAFPGCPAGELLEPANNLGWGAFMLFDLARVFKHEQEGLRWRCALAAFHAGLGYVVQAQALAVARGLDPHDWAVLRALLPETRPDRDGCWSALDPVATLNFVEEVWQRCARRPVDSVPGGNAVAAC